MIITLRYYSKYFLQSLLHSVDKIDNNEIKIDRIDNNKIKIVFYFIQFYCYRNHCNMPRISKATLKRREQGFKLGRRNAMNANSLPTAHAVSPDADRVEENATKKKLSREVKSLNMNIKDREFSKKDSGNRIIHWDSMKSLVCSNLCCNRCGSGVKLNEKTVGIATQVGIVCNNSNCGLNEKNIVRRTDYSRNGEIRKDSSASFALNCQFILFLMQIGGGATEAGLAVTYLELPHSSTFEKTTFKRVHKAIRPAIVNVTDQSMKEGREEEILATVGKENFDKWKEKKITPDEVKLTTSYDMGWNKRSSGTKYDSTSGHGFVIGGLTKKILQHVVLSKSCSICSFAIKSNRIPQRHECPKNHIGSSKSMECEGIFRMVVQAHDELGYTIGTIISDDDSTMKSNLKHSLKEKVQLGLMCEADWPKTQKGNKKSDNGRLPLNIPEPHFLADFNHRVKVVGKTIYYFAKMAKKHSNVSKGTAERVKTNWGSMLRQIRHLSWEKDHSTIKSRVLAPIEHMYGNHDHCDESWCPYLKAQNEQKEYVPKEGKEIFCKKENKREYEQMVKAVERFQTDENIKECLHSFDTQYNESLNMSVARYVPKFKHFGTTMSLESRVRCVIGVHNLGYSKFYLTLLTNLGCLGKSDEYRLLLTGITRISNTKLKNKHFKQTTAYKRRRKHGQQSKTKQQLYEEGIDRANRIGTYESGIAILGDDDDDDEQQQRQDTRQSNLLHSHPPKKKNRTSLAVCSLCGLSGHKTSRSKACKFHSEYLQKQQRNKLDENRRDESEIIEQVANENTNELTSTPMEVNEMSGEQLVSDNGKLPAASVPKALPSLIDKNFSLSEKVLDVKLGTDTQNYEKNEKVKSAKKTIAETHPVPHGAELTFNEVYVQYSTNNITSVNTIGAPTSVETDTKDTGGVENMFVCTPVNKDVESYETTAQSVRIDKKRQRNSSEDKITHVELAVENMEFVDDNENMNFQTDDENSNISFFTAVDSV